MEYSTIVLNERVLCITQLAMFSTTHRSYAQLTFSIFFVKHGHPIGLATANTSLVAQQLL